MKSVIEDRFIEYQIITNVFIVFISLVNIFMGFFVLKATMFQIVHFVLISIFASVYGGVFLFKKTGQKLLNYKYRFIYVVVDFFIITMACLSTAGTNSPFLVILYLTLISYPARFGLEDGIVAIALGLFVFLGIFSGLGKAITLPLITIDFFITAIIYGFTLAIYLGLSANRDISLRGKLYHANLELEYMSRTDGLTGLYNHSSFKEYLHSLICLDKTEQRIGVIIIDIDDFKSINDNYGHLEGDRLLRLIAGIIAKNIRDNDLAFRYGGEEFTVIVENVDEEELEVVCERIRSSIEECDFLVHDVSLKITASIGGAIYPEHATNLEELIKAADKALYEVKSTTKNQTKLAEVALS